MFKREQAIIPRSTQCDWLIAGAITLKPLLQRMIHQLLYSKVIRTDDTWVKVQDRKLESNMRTGKKRNKEFLETFCGFVQADASNGLDALFTDGTKTETSLLRGGVKS